MFIVHVFIHVKLGNIEAFKVATLANVKNSLQERLALPELQGDHLVCIWDEQAGTWQRSFESYDHAGTYEFQVPAWGKWYWIGLWDEQAAEYVFGKWIGHFITE